MIGGLFAVGIVAAVLLVAPRIENTLPADPAGLVAPTGGLAHRCARRLSWPALVSLITFLPIYLQWFRGHSPAETGLLLVPLTVGIGTGSLTTGWLVSKTGRTTIFRSSGWCS